MGANKFEYFGVVKLDLTNDTITSDVLIDGYTAHDKSGEPIVGSFRKMPLPPLEYDYNIGYIDNGTWKYENPTNTYTDIYEVVGGQSYVLILGANVGSRFRTMFSTTDIRGRTSDFRGTAIINTNNPQPRASAVYTAPSDGYILVAKDNVGKSGVNSYLFYGDAIFI